MASRAPSHKPSPDAAPSAAAAPGPGPTPSSTRRTAFAAIGVVALAAVLVLAVWLEATLTAPTRDATRAFTRLITAANRGDLSTANSLCSAQFRQTHPLKLAEEGGIIGLPRQIQKNFRVWRSGTDIHLCPTNRMGPVFRLVREGDQWLFDGIAGYLHARGQFTPAEPALDIN